MDSFGDLLRNFRQDAELTQLELAQLAGVGIETVSALERGISSRPRVSTTQRLAEALQLSGDDRCLFEASARSKRYNCKKLDNQTDITSLQYSDFCDEHIASDAEPRRMSTKNGAVEGEYDQVVLRKWADDLTMPGTQARNRFPEISSQLENSMTVPLRASSLSVLTQRRGISERILGYFAISFGGEGLEQKYRAISLLIVLPIILLLVVPWLLSPFNGLPVAASAVGALQVVGGKMGIQSEGLHYTDTGGAYIATGEVITSTLSIRNTDPTASHAIALQVLDLSVRGPDACSKGWSAGVADFSPNTNIVLKPGEEYKYKESRSFDIPGIYFMEPTRLDKGGAKWGGIGPFPRVYYAVVDSRTGTWPTNSDKCLPLPTLLTSVFDRH